MGWHWRGSGQSTPKTSKSSWTGHYRGPLYKIKQRNLSQLDWASLEERRNQLKALMMYKIVNGLAPAYLNDVFEAYTGFTNYTLRNSNKNLALPRTRTDY